MNFLIIPNNNKSMLKKQLNLIFKSFMDYNIIYITDKYYSNSFYYVAKLIMNYCNKYKECALCLFYYFFYRFPNAIIHNIFIPYCI